MSEAGRRYTQSAIVRVQCDCHSRHSLTNQTMFSEQKYIYNCFFLLLLVSKQFIFAEDFFFFEFSVALNLVIEPI